MSSSSPRYVSISVSETSHSLPDDELPHDRLSADHLRSIGIDHSLAKDDEDLESAVEFALASGMTLGELAGGRFAALSYNRRLRPSTWHGSEMTAQLDAAAVDPDFSQRLRVAMGFNQGTGLGLTPDELDASAFLASLRTIMGDDELLALVRVMGTSSARLARAATAQLRLSLDTPLIDESARLTDLLRSYGALIDHVLPAFLDANSTLLRRHFADVIGQSGEWQPDSTRSATMQEVVVGFADLVGFTSFTEEADVQQFMQAIGKFEHDVQGAIVNNGGVLVKMIGDEVMFVAQTAESAVAIARGLAGVGADLADLQGMRIGLASGTVIASAGDYFGTVVNIAARSVRQARPNGIVVTERVFGALADASGFELVGVRELAGISEPQQLYRLQL